MSLDLAIQKALKARLEVITLAAVGGSLPVLDGPGPGDELPYIELGSSQMIPDDAECVAGETHIQTIHVWINSDRSLGTCRAVVGQLYRNLHNGDMALEAGDLVMMRVETTRVMRDRDGITAHGVISLEVWAEDV